MKTKRKAYIREVEQRVVQATRDDLLKFSLKELRLYAKSLGFVEPRSKDELVDILENSGRARMLAQLLI